MWTSSEDGFGPQGRRRSLDEFTTIWMDGHGMGCPYRATLLRFPDRTAFRI
jgi:hypothetical protein